MSGYYWEIKLVIELIIAIFGALFFLKDLSTCAMPMHLWVIGWWVLLLGGLFASCFHEVRLWLGDQRGVALIGVFFAFNFIGLFMYIYSMIRTPQCFPMAIKREFLTFMICVGTLVLMALIYVIMLGAGRLKQKFFDERANEQVIDRILHDEVNVEAYIAANHNIDTYVLFPSEVKLLKDHCARPSTAEAGLRHEAECCICMDLLESQPLAIDFPGCAHPFHDSCILKWLEKKTSCPMCRGGVRSSLYRTLAKHNVAVHPTEHEPLI